jgi:hypothetical protein
MFVIVGLVPTTQTYVRKQNCKFVYKPKNWFVGTSPTMTSEGVAQ